MVLTKIVETLLATNVRLSILCLCVYHSVPFCRCFSPVGRQYLQPGMQELSIGDGCNSKGIIMHELMHALGFWHEQSRSDRDDYMEILWENVKKGTDVSLGKSSRVVFLCWTFTSRGAVKRFCRCSVSPISRVTVSWDNILSL